MAAPPASELCGLDRVVPERDYRSESFAPVQQINFQRPTLNFNSQLTLLWEQTGILVQYSHVVRTSE